MITLTEQAASHIRSILEQEQDLALKLRVYIEGGGCSGFQYGFKLIDIPDKDDLLFESCGINLVVDPISAEYLDGAILDFKKTFLSSHFVVDNPNAAAQCGCGTSFAI